MAFRFRSDTRCKRLLVFAALLLTVAADVRAQTPDDPELLPPEPPSDEVPGPLPQPTQADAPPPVPPPPQAAPAAPPALPRVDPLLWGPDFKMVLLLSAATSAVSMVVLVPGVLLGVAASVGTVMLARRTVTSFDWLPNVSRVGILSIFLTPLVLPVVGGVLAYAGARMVVPHLVPSIKDARAASRPLRTRFLMMDALAHVAVLTPVLGLVAGATLFAFVTMQASQWLFQGQSTSRGAYLGFSAGSVLALLSGVAASVLLIPAAIVAVQWMGGWLLMRTLEHGGAL